MWTERGRDYGSKNYNYSSKMFYNSGRICQDNSFIGASSGGRNNTFYHSSPRLVQDNVSSVDITIHPYFATISRQCSEEG
jgi:hypothetical protein